MNHISALLTTSVLTLLLTACGGGSTSVGIGTGGSSGGGGGTGNAAAVPAGVFQGTAPNNNREYLAVILDGSGAHSFFWFYSAPGGQVATAVDGFLSGSLTTATGNGFDVGTLANFDLANPTSGIAATLTDGHYNANQITGDLTQGGTGSTFYQFDLLTSATLPNVPRANLDSTYLGLLKNDAVGEAAVSATFNVVSNGNAFTGSVGACSFSGALSDSQLNSVYQVVLPANTGTGDCFGDHTKTRIGVAVVLPGGNLQVAVTDVLGTTAAAFY